MDSKTNPENTIPSTLHMHSTSVGSGFGTGSINGARSAGITVMVCRIWTEVDAFGTKIGDRYIFSDIKGYTIQSFMPCSAENGHCCTLQEGKVYLIENFVLVPNTNHVRFCSQATTLLQLGTNTIINEVAFPLDGVMRHPIQITDVQDIVNNDSEHLIDIAGLVLEIGVSRPTNKGNWIVDCTVVDASGSKIRLTVWNEAATTLLNLQQKYSPMNICIFTGMDVKNNDGELYLSTTHASAIYTTQQFPAVHARFKRFIRYGFKFTILMAA